MAEGLDAALRLDTKRASHFRARREETMERQKQEEIEAAKEQRRKTMAAKAQFMKLWEQGKYTKAFRLAEVKFQMHDQDIDDWIHFTQYGFENKLID